TAGSPGLDRAGAGANNRADPTLRSAASLEERPRMNHVMTTLLLAATGTTMLASCAMTQPSQSSAKDMTFFVTSVGPGKGANLGGLDGADQHCQNLARSVGAGDKVWRAYLSTQAPAL